MMYSVWFRIHSKMQQKTDRLFLWNSYSKYICAWQAWSQYWHNMWKVTHNLGTGRNAAAAWDGVETDYFMTKWHFRGDTIKWKILVLPIPGGNPHSKGTARTAFRTQERALGCPWRKYSQRVCTKERLAEERRHRRNLYYPSQWYGNLCKYCSKGFWGKWKKQLPYKSPSLLLFLCHIMLRAAQRIVQ